MLRDPWGFTSMKYPSLFQVLSGRLRTYLLWGNNVGVLSTNWVDINVLLDANTENFKKRCRHIL